VSEFVLKLLRSCSYHSSVRNWCIMGTMGSSTVFC